ncbi:hypothetical protein V6U90_30035 [Micromonospora sp. CPCC 206060]
MARGGRRTDLFFLDVAVSGTVLGVGLAKSPEQGAQVFGEEFGT